MRPCHPGLGLCGAKLLRAGAQTVRFETRFSGALTVRKDGETLLHGFSRDVREDLRNAAADPDPRPRAWTTSIHVLEVNETYIAVYEHEDAIQNMRPDFTRLEQLHPFVVSVTAPGEKADFVSRYFEPSYGMPEDPVTGSAHCALAPYWAERLGKTRLHARQIIGTRRRTLVRMAGTRVILKGHAVLTLQGSLAI